MRLIDLQSLTVALQNEAKAAGHQHPLFIGIDQENGLVTRICPPIATQVPGPMALGATHSPELAYEMGKATGETLNFFGINMNYTPVCDINSEPLNPVIGVRSPGDDPELVGRFTSAAARGMREQGIIPSAKHFPGHGETAVDSHYGLPIIPKTRDQLERCELVPFRRAVAEGIESVMTAHIALPEIGDSKLPATLSADALNILRKDMNYDGMVVTDCLEMDGIRATYGTEQGSVFSLNAGSDSVMICHTHSVQMASIDKVCEAIQTGVMPLGRFEEAHRRVSKLKNSFLTWESALRTNPTEDLTSLNKKTADLAKDAYSRSVTLVRSSPNVLPLSKSSKIVFLFPGASTPAGGAVDGEGLGRKGAYNLYASKYGDVLRLHNESVTEIFYEPAGLSSEQWNLVESADVVILTTINARESAYQRDLGLELPKRARTLVSIAACAPYDFLEDESIENYITTYEPTMPAFIAAADILFGVSTAKGTLPVGQENAKIPIKVAPFDSANDLQQLFIVWDAALPTYPMSIEHLCPLVVGDNGHHFVARIESTLVGFCLGYISENQGKVSGQIAALAVDPKYQGQGVGTALLAETRAYFRNQFGLNNLTLGSTFPRFWPGIPRDLPSQVQDFFIHRGFRLDPPTARSVDLYQDIRDFQAPEKYITHAKERGYIFGPLKPEHHEECKIAQSRNFSTYTVSHNPQPISDNVGIRLTQ